MAQQLKGAVNDGWWAYFLHFQFGVAGKFGGNPFNPDHPDLYVSGRYSDFLRAIETQPGRLPYQRPTPDHEYPPACSGINSLCIGTVSPADIDIIEYRSYISLNVGGRRWFFIL